VTEPKRIEKSNRKLQRRQSKLVGLLVLAVFGAIWNGVTGTFLFLIIRDFTRGHGNWLPVLFISPFVLIGLLVIYGFIYSLLGMFNPKFEITLDNEDVRIGDRLTGKWRTTFGASRVKKLKVILQGMEESEYRKGTSTYTDKSIFAQIVVHETKLLREIEKYSFDVAIPKDTMHTLEGDSNKIIWSIIVQGEIPFWPDLSEELAIQVKPMAATKLLRRKTDDDAYSNLR
jgi:hypothetical protein